MRAATRCPATRAPGRRASAAWPATSSICRWPRVRAAIAFRAAWSGHGLPALRAFAPELLIISAGFDAHRADPLAQLELETADFGWITGELLACAPRVISVLEGGYDLAALAACTAEHVRTLIAA